MQNNKNNCNIDFRLKGVASPVLNMCGKFSLCFSIKTRIVNYELYYCTYIYIASYAELQRHQGQAAIEKFYDLSFNMFFTDFNAFVPYFC